MSRRRIRGATAVSVDFSGRLQKAQGVDGWRYPINQAANRPRIWRTCERSIRCSMQNRSHLAAGLIATGLIATVAAACGGGATPVQMPGAVVNKGSLNDSRSGAAFTVTIDVGDDWFSPTFIKAPPGAHVTLHLVDVGQMTHTFTIDGQHVDVVLDSRGQKAGASIVVPSSGQPVIFYCKYHQAVGMQGAFYSK